MVGRIESTSQRCADNERSGMNVAVETAAPNLTLPDHEGHAVRLDSLWRAKPLVLLFVRHFG